MMTSGLTPHPLPSCALSPHLTSPSPLRTPGPTFLPFPIMVLLPLPWGASRHVSTASPPCQVWRERVTSGQQVSTSRTMTASQCLHHQRQSRPFLWTRRCALESRDLGSARWTLVMDGRPAKVSR